MLLRKDTSQEFLRLSLRYLAVPLLQLVLSDQLRLIHLLLQLDQLRLSRHQFH